MYCFALFVVGQWYQHELLCVWVWDELCGSLLKFLIEILLSFHSVMYFDMTLFWRSICSIFTFLNSLCIEEKNKRTWTAHVWFSSVKAYKLAFPKRGNRKAFALSSGDHKLKSRWRYSHLWPAGEVVARLQAHIYHTSTLDPIMDNLWAQARPLHSPFWVAVARLGGKLGGKLGGSADWCDLYSLLHVQPLALKNVSKE